MEGNGETEVEVYQCTGKKKKKKNPFRGKNETEVAHVQSFTDFNPKQKRKKSFIEGSEKTSLFLSCQTEVYP